MGGRLWARSHEKSHALIPSPNTHRCPDFQRQAGQLSPPPGTCPGPSAGHLPLAPRRPASPFPNFRENFGRCGPSHRRRLPHTCGNKRAPPARPAPLEARPRSPRHPPGRGRPPSRGSRTLTSGGGRRHLPPRPRPAHRTPATRDGSRECPGL